MNEKDASNKPPQSSSSTPEKKPDEVAGFYFSSHIKIYDPDTKKVLVQRRGDN